MMNFDINLTSLAVILWSGMLIIAGSIWVLSSQVRRLSDVMEEHARATTTGASPAPRGSSSAPVALARGTTRRNASSRVRGITRIGA